MCRTLTTDLNSISDIECVKYIGNNNNNSNNEIYYYKISDTFTLGIISDVQCFWT